jgi:CheY-like chemotaxis protein
MAPRVLIVDDHALNLELAKFVLEGAGYEVVCVAGGEQALEQVQSFCPELILMDIQMKGVDGLELTRRLKADQATRHIVVVAFTAYAMKGDEAKFRSAGCDGYISKPIDVNRFADTVRAFLQAGVAAPGSTGATPDPAPAR